MPVCRNLGLHHALKIHDILQEMSEDLEYSGTCSDDELSDDDEEFFGSDWNDLALDDEMANMVLESLSFSQFEDSLE